MSAKKTIPTLPLQPDEVRNPAGGGTMKKVDRYGWTTLDKPGKFAWVPKDRIRIDHTYQREKVILARVNRIASQFVWRKFGVLLLVLRDDGFYYCFDGQHRFLAAEKRSDIQTLPALIFPVFSQVEEASSFLVVNGDRGSVRLFDKINALLTSNDPTAVTMKAMIEASGYRMSRDHGNKRVACVGAIYTAIERDAEAAATAWQLCVDLFQGDPPHDRVFQGLWCLERALRKAAPGRSLADEEYRKTILKAGPSKLQKAIQEAAIYRHAGGHRVYAEGVANVVNKGRRHNFVPSMAPGESYD